MALLSVVIFEADVQRSWICELSDEQAVEITLLLSEAHEKGLIEDFDLTTYDAQASARDLFRSMNDMLEQGRLFDV